MPLPEPSDEVVARSRGAEFVFRLLTGRSPEQYVLGLEPDAPSRRAHPWQVVAWLCGAAGGAVVAMVIYALWLQLVVPTQAAYLVLLTVLFSISFVLFVRSMEKEDRLSIESHWGGLGGGLGGWRISSSVTFLITTAALFALLLIAMTSERPRPDLRERYRAAMNFGELRGMQFKSRDIVGHKLVLKGTAPTEQVYKDFWNQVKLANAVFDDIVVEVTIQKGAGETAQNSNVSP